MVDPRLIQLCHLSVNERWASEDMLGVSILPRHALPSQFPKNWHVVRSLTTQMICAGSYRLALGADSR